jgi:hypothetical protein
LSRNVATDADLLALLRTEVEAAGGVRAFARAKGISAGHVCDVLGGRREISEEMGNRLGFLREVRWVPFAIRRVA